MHHEPSGSCLALQAAADQRCPACQAVMPLDRIPAGLPAGCCASCRRRSAAVARRHRQQILRQVARRAEAGYRILLAQQALQSGGDDAA
jgi:hypothetical protein